MEHDVTTERLLAAFIDERGSLTPADSELLAGMLKADGDSASELKDQSLTHDLLARRLNPVRIGFCARVRRAVGSAAPDLFVQSVMSRVKAEGRNGAPHAASVRRGRWNWLPAFAAAAAALLAAAGVWFGLTNAERGTRPDYAKATSGKSAELTARITESQGGVWGYGRVGVRELKVGDEVRQGTRIETGDGGRVRLSYEAEKTEVTVIGRSVFSVRRSGGGQGQVALEKGKLAATVSRQKPGAPFVVLTPQARIEVKGTRFALGVDVKATRLEVLEGLVGMTRLSDGKSVDVAAGQYAVAAEGVDLAAMALPDSARRAAEQAFAQPVPKRSRYGKVLFDDEFDGTLENWDVIVGTVGGKSRVLKGNLAPYARLEKNLRHVQVTQTPDTSAIVLESCVVLDAQEGTDQYVKLISKRPIEADRFVVELGCVFAATGQKGKTFIEPTGIEALEENMTDTGEKLGIVPVEYGPLYTVHRWEFRPGPDGKLRCRMFRGGVWKSDVYLGGMFKSCLVKPESKRMMFGFQGSAWHMIVDRVRVREILDDDVAESGQQ